MVGRRLSGAAVAAFIAVFISAGVGLAGCSREAEAPPKPSFNAIDITGADYARGFELTDADGRRRTLAEFKGRIPVVFFGFTQCPDVCPSTLIELAEVKKALGADGDRVQGIFITVDPARDTPEVLKAYVGNFGADFVALRGSEAETLAVAKHFKVFYAKVPGKGGADSYTMDHTAGLFVFDAQGRVRLFTRQNSEAQALLADLKLLLAEAPPT